MAENNESKEIPDLEVLFDLADLFKVFGDSTRIRIMFAISDNEMSVLSIAQALNMEQRGETDLLHPWWRPCEENHWDGTWPCSWIGGYYEIQLYTW